MNVRKWLMVSGLVGMVMLGLALYFNPIGLPLSFGLAVSGTPVVLYSLLGGAVILALKYIKALFE